MVASLLAITFSTSEVEAACKFYTYTGCENCTAADADDSSCPEWVKGWGKTRPLSEIGLKGYVAFIHQKFPNRNGRRIGITPLSHFSPTYFDYVAKSVDFSDDGNWLLVGSEYSAFLMKRDGTHKTDIPLPRLESKSGWTFYRSGPYGQEIVQASSRNGWWAIRK